MARTLTRSQREVVQRVKQGLSNKAIAQELWLSVRTVEGRIYRACRRVSVHSRHELAQLTGDTP